jgi:hypothetical protein
LSSEDVEAFQRDGFVVVRDVFTDKEVAMMAEAADRLIRLARGFEETTMWHGSQFVISEREPVGNETPDGNRLDTQPPTTRIDRIVWCGGAEPTFSRYGADRRLLRMAADLLESRRMSQLINQLHIKEPGDGVHFEWHQDSTHRRYGTNQWRDLNGRGSFIETATAIDPMTPKNGPLQFLPGTHRHEHIEPDPETGQLPDEVLESVEPVSLEMAPGDVCLFGPFIIHGSDENRSDEPRRLFLNGYAFPGANDREYPGAEAGRMLTA